MESNEFKPNDPESTAKPDLRTSAINDFTKDGAVVTTNQQGEKQLFERDSGGPVEIDDKGNRYRVDPITGERIGVIEYGDLSQD